MFTVLLVDDLNLPLKEHSPLAVLRSLIEYYGWYIYENRQFGYMSNVAVLGVYQFNEHDQENDIFYQGGKSIIAGNLKKNLIKFTVPDLTKEDYREIFRSCIQDHFSPEYDYVLSQSSKMVNQIYSKL